MAARRSLPAGADLYGVGPKVRRLRLRKKISLEDLGRHTGLSPALLSKLERGRVMPTLPTLMRIAPVFGIGLGEFFIADKPGAVVVRAQDRLRFPELLPEEQSAYEFESLDFSATDRGMNAYLAEFRLNRVARLHTHEAEEFLHVLAGQLIVHVDGADRQLETGDSIYIHSSVPHGYARHGTARCLAVVVTSGAPGAAAYDPPTLPDRHGG
jgi:transcriptional regulator with XRE-family HTH domain